MGPRCLAADRTEPATECVTSRQPEWTDGGDEAHRPTTCRVVAISSREATAHVCLSLRPRGLGASPAAQAEQGGSGRGTCSFCSSTVGPHQAGRSTRPQAEAYAEGSQAWSLGPVPGSGRPSVLEKPSRQEGPGGARRGALTEVKDLPQRSFSNSCTAGGPQQSQSRPLPHRGGCWQLWLCPAPTLPRPLLTVLPEGCGMWRGNQYEEKSYSSLRSGACAGETGSTPRPPARRWSFLCSDCTARLHGSLDSPQGWPQGPEGGSGWAHAAVGEVLSANLSLSLQVPRLQPWEPGDKQLGD